MLPLPLRKYLQFYNIELSLFHLSLCVIVCIIFQEEGVHTVHQGAVSSLVTHPCGSLLLTSCAAVHDTSLWSLSDMMDEK